ncbi:MAG TPA: hypothetical protein VF017_15340 [Thermoanaerobaculia bacterium]|nr:hypothetical protein [Thermoanaerobaculia bacterium]
MSWILKEQLGDRPASYLREFVAIGPACTQDEGLAMRFGSREEALIASSRHWAPVTYEPVEIPDPAEGAAA